MHTQHPKHLRGPYVQYLLSCVCDKVHAFDRLLNKEGALFYGRWKELEKISSERCCLNDRREKPWLNHVDKASMSCGLGEILERGLG